MSLLIMLTVNTAVIPHAEMGTYSIYKTHFHLASAAASTALAALPQHTPHKKIILKSWHALSLLVHAGLTLERYLLEKKALTCIESIESVKKRLSESPENKEWLSRIELVEQYIAKNTQKAGITLKNIVFVDFLPPFGLYTIGSGNNALILISSNWIEDEKALRENLEAGLAHEIAHAKLHHNSINHLMHFISAAWFDALGLCCNVPKKGYAAQLAFHSFLKKQLHMGLKRCHEFSADAHAAEWTSPEQADSMLKFIERTIEGNPQLPAKKTIPQFLKDSVNTHPEFYRRIAYLKKPNVSKKNPIANPFCYAWW